VVVNRPLVVAIDLSTTACKTVAFEPGGDPVAIARVALTKVSPRPGWQEQDSQGWWTAACAALTELMAQVDAADVAAICVTHQRETFVCLDEDGAALRPAILWLDTRAASQVGRLGSRRIHEVSGKPPSTTPSLYKLAWLADHEPDVLRRTSTVADVHAYLVRRLTGRWVTSWASADPSGLVDMRTFEYSPELLATVGLRVDQLPELVAPGVTIGEVSEDAALATGLRTGLPVVAGAGDGQCAGLGAAICEEGRAYLNLGTAVTLGCHSERYHASLAFRTLSSPVAGKWTLEAVLASGALSLAWFGREVAGDASPDAYQRLEAAAAEIEPGSEGLLFLPYISGVGTPYWDSAARGAWVGLQERHGLAHMYRAVLEGTAFEQLIALSMIGSAVGSDTSVIRAMGGGSRSSLWVQVLADILGKPVEVTQRSETTALGAAILAAAAMSVDGEGGVVATAKRMSRGWRTVEPELGGVDAERYRGLAEVYARLYPVLAPIFRQIGEIETG
jgi:xylulokinase